MTDLLIIGGGPAGLTAAVYAARGGLCVKVLEELSPGGQVALTPEVENYPGIKNISGADLAVSLFEQAVALGVEIEFERAEKIIQGTVKTIKTESGEYSARAVIIANGAKRRKLGIKGEDEFSGKGVSYCAVCDGAFYKGKRTAVIGGGNTALEDALYLAKVCEKVYLVHRRDEFRGAKSLVDRVLANDKIEILYSTIPEEIIGDSVVEKIRLCDKKSGESFEKDVSGVFVAIGLEPDNKRFSDVVDLEDGYIRAGEDCKTSADGIFAAGDTRTKALRQIVTATADGAVAATGVIELLA